MLVSSIVPPMGRLRRTAQVSNAALRAVCSREKASVVDHTDAFTARSGAPRKDLNKDQVHPSDSGAPRKDLNRDQVHPSDSGTPRKDLNRDQVHPSDSGTSRPVFNLQLGTGTRHRSAQQEHQTGSRPHQKRDSPQLQPKQQGIPTGTPDRLPPPPETRQSTAPAKTARDPTPSCNQAFAVGTRTFRIRRVSVWKSCIVSGMV